MAQTASSRAAAFCTLRASAQGSTVQTSSNVLARLSGGVHERRDGRDGPGGRDGGILARHLGAILKAFDSPGRESGWDG